MLVLIAGYTMIQCVQSTLPFWFSRGYHYDEQIALCTWDIADIFKPDSVVFVAMYAVFVILEFAVPILPVLVSCGISIYALQQSKTVQDARQCKNFAAEGTLRKRHATKTILIVTLFYAVCNVPLAVYLSLTAYDLFNPSQVHVLDFDQDYFYLGNLLLVISVGVNAAGNPLLTLTRNGQQKRYVKKSWVNVKKDVVRSMSQLSMTVESLHCKSAVVMTRSAPPSVSAPPPSVSSPPLVTRSAPPSVSSPPLVTRSAPPSCSS